MLYSQFLTSWRDPSVDISVVSTIGIVNLCRKCVSTISPKWNQWSRGYPLPLPEEVTIWHKGAPAVGDVDCLLQFFSKKVHGISARILNFSIVLDLNLVIENKLYQEVSNHLEQGYDVLGAGASKVSGNFAQLYDLSAYQP